MTEDFLIKALATFRLTHMIREEEGPFEIVYAIRQWLGITLENKIVSHGLRGEIARAILICFWCASVWVALFVWLLPARLLKPLAFSAIAVMIKKWLERIQ